MNKARKKIPQKIKNSVLKEFNHLCAICASVSPQIHHIDENPNNNIESNLIPLCPNCHLRDQHDPTRTIEIGRLIFFRKYKDPAILSAQFKPFYKRIKFIYRAESNRENCIKAYELISFVKELHMGEFYKNRLLPLLHLSSTPFFLTIPEKTGPKETEYYKQQCEKISSSTDQIEELIMELLCYQDWKYVSP